MLGLLIVLGGGYLLLKNSTTPAQTTNFAKVPNVGGPATPSQQPGQQYPFAVSQPIRVDNSSQPWYGGSRAVTSTSNPTKPAAQPSATNPVAVATQAANLWNTLGVSDWFSSGSPTQDEDEDA